MPGGTESIIVMSSSGDLKVKGMKMPSSKKNKIPKIKNKKINRAIADYLYIATLKE
jgi:hypothetical protein